jgi:hypothetical protein
MQRRLTAGKGDVLKAISLSAIENLFNDHHIQIPVCAMSSVKTMPASEVTAVCKLYCYP